MLPAGGAYRIGHKKSVCLRQTLEAHINACDGAQHSGPGHGILVPAIVDSQRHAGSLDKS